MVVPLGGHVDTASTARSKSESSLLSSSPPAGAFALEEPLVPELGLELGASGLDDTDRVGDADNDCEGELEAVLEGLAPTLKLSDGDAVMVVLGELEAVFDADGEDECDTDADAEVEGAAELDQEFDGESLADGSELPDSETDGEPESEGEDVGAGVSDADAPLVTDPVAVPEGAAEFDAVELADAAEV